MMRGETGGVDGTTYSLAEHVRTPYPLPENPDVPILIGTWGPKLAAVAGEIADEVKIGGSANPDFVPVMADYIRVGEEKAKRTPGTVGIVVGAVCVVDNDGEQARALARREVALYLPVVAKLDKTVSMEPERVARIRDYVEGNDLDGAASQIPDDLLDRFAFSGTPKQVAAQCNALFEAGASRIEFGTPHGITPQTGLNLLAHEVIPRLAR
jgi:5,10-methylenetetrahydromethanopterin reductase